MRKYIYIFFLVGLVFGLASCKLNKSTTEEPIFTLGNSGDKSAKIIAFNNYYMDAIKADLVENNPNKAIDKLKKCLTLDANNTAVLFKIGQMYDKVQQYADATKVLEKAVDLDKENVWFYLLLADVYQKQSKTDKAVEIYKSLVKIKPLDISYQFSLANLHLRNNEPENAIKIYNDIESEIGINDQLSVQKKNIYLSLNKAEKAIEEIEKLIDAYPENTDYIRLLIDLYIANGHEYKVVELYKKIIEINPHDGTAHLIIADYYLRNNKIKEGTEMGLKAIGNPNLDVQTKLTFLVLNYLNKEINEGNREVVLKMADLMIETHPENPRAFTFRGDVYTSLKEDKKAMSDYKTALGFEKNIVELWKKVIGFELEKGHYKSAIDFAEEALEYFPTSPEIYWLNGLAHLRLQENKNAENLLLQGLDYIVNDKWLQYQFYTNLGEVYNSLKEYANSDKYFEMAMEIDTIDPFVLNNYAYYLSLRKDKLEKAKTMSAKSLEIDPDNPAYLDTYGWILYLNGEYAEAKEYIERALKVKPWDADILEHLGDSCYQLGLIEEALKHWEKAKRKGSVSEFIDKKIADKKLYE
ncbi:MAG: tetratricopeptide repeat protein [Bacteroidetes bacterium]|nr:tetratricopeptide repeat protein [Bacteroidota bacterium]MBT5528878.1 tetratricopeptide repeat protein [Cytophagia bacterium]MBT3933992.1 tetratricopeptide repeat protein [Bacteroidota bacterium]MBT4729343.1 tetratricopeptide repeat protein [Bacteroidota bacterium]MBT4968004.1 tetratricopeptide repeat protein [Bacteroidota bacterium]